MVSWCLRSCGYPKFGPSFSWVRGMHLPFYQGFFLAGGGFPFLAGGWLPFYQGCFALTACCCFFSFFFTFLAAGFLAQPFPIPKASLRLAFPSGATSWQTRLPFLLLLKEGPGRPLTFSPGSSPFTKGGFSFIWFFGRGCQGFGETLAVHRNF